MIPDLGVQAWGDLKGYNYAIIMGENLATQHQLNSRPKEIHQPVALWASSCLLLLVPCAALQFLHQLGHRDT